MALIELKSNLNTKIGGTNTTENGTFSVNQGDNVERDTKFEKEQVREQYKKFKPDEDQLITHDIGDRYRGTNNDGGFVRGGFILNTDRQVEDTKRLTKYLTTPKGFLFKTKQSILQKKNTDPNTREYDRSSIIRNIDSTTAVLNGNVAEAGENRHIGNDTYEDRFDSEGFRTDKNLKIPNAESKLKQFGGEANTFKQQIRAIALDPNEEGQASEAEQFERIKYENLAKVNEQDDFLNPAPDAVTIMSKRQNTRGRKKLQISYGGEFGNLKQSAAELPKDFIKFRIREAVTGKWIIFPAFISGITDNSNASYASANYIGRPDAVHVYQNRTRSISFSIKTLATNPTEIMTIWEKINYLKGLTQPHFKPFFNNESTTNNSTELNTRPVAPFVYLTIGDMFVNTPGLFESVNVTIPEASSWETIDGLQFPHMCDISCTFKYIGKEIPTLTGVNYDGIKRLVDTNRKADTEKLNNPNNQIPENKTEAAIGRQAEKYGLDPDAIRETAANQTPELSPTTKVTLAAAELRLERDEAARQAKLQEQYDRLNKDKIDLQPRTTSFNPSIFAPK
jgi:hypothetical protein